MNTQPNPESILEERLRELKAVPARSPRAAARGRAQFLAQAAAAREARRHKGWGFLSFRQPRFALNMLVTLVVIVTLFVGSETTVLAAQNDLPGEPLYGIKVFSEDVSLQFQNSPEAKVERLMQLAETRIQEMTQLVDAGRTPPEAVRLRLEQHLQQTLLLCSKMDDATLSRTLPRVHARLRQQEQDMLRLQGHAGQGAQPILEHTRTMLASGLQLVDNGLLNHDMFRSTIRSGFHYEQTEPAPVVSTTPTPRRELNSPATPRSGSPNGNGLGPNNNPSATHAHVTPTPKANGNNSGNNGGGNNKTKPPKDKPPKDKTPPDNSSDKSSDKKNK
jgi:hypothetical protein